MKKLKINAESLMFREASTSFGEKLQAVKLTPEQAITFKDRLLECSQVPAYCRPSLMLKLGESYDGYLLVFYPFVGCRVVYLRGTIVSGVDRYIVAAEKGSVCFSYVETFQHTPFAYNILSFRDLYQKSIVTLDYSLDFDEVEVASQLQQKLAEALLNKSYEVELTDDEYTTLVLYYTKEQFSRMFTHLD